MCEHRCQSCDGECDRQTGSCAKCSATNCGGVCDITAEHFVINDKVQFEFNKATISRKSYRLLDDVAKALNEHPEAVKVRIEGHTDRRVEFAIAELDPSRATAQ